MSGPSYVPDKVSRRLQKHSNSKKQLWRCTGVTVLPVRIGVPVYHELLSLIAALETATNKKLIFCLWRFGPGRCKNAFLPPQKHRKKQYEVHLEVTRLERHAIFRRSISLDDVDCFDTLK